jgi:hypothetical protein
MLVALDRLLVECSRRGLRLLPTLTNYWKEYGGMAQYAKCATHACRRLLPTASLPHPFLHSAAPCIHSVHALWTFVHCSLLVSNNLKWALLPIRSASVRWDKLGTGVYGPTKEAGAVAALHNNPS